jgi:hypothetical protein
MRKCHHNNTPLTARTTGFTENSLFRRGNFSCIFSAGRNMDNFISAVTDSIMFVSRVMKALEIAAIPNGGFS